MGTKSKKRNSGLPPGEPTVAEINKQVDKEQALIVGFVRALVVYRELQCSKEDRLDEEMEAQTEVNRRGYQIEDYFKRQAAKGGSGYVGTFLEELCDTVVEAC